MKKLLASLVGLALLSLLGGCAVIKAGPEADTLRCNLGSEPPSLDWHTSTDSTSFDVVSNIMVGLTQYTNDLKVAPCIASSWEVLDGGKRYVFHLRKDVKWSDGKPLVAGDFEYAWRRLLDPKTGAQYAYFIYDVLNAREFNTSKITDPDQVGVRAIDDYTFEVRLSRPVAYFIYLSAYAPTFPMRRDIVEKFGDRWTEPGNIVTDGPFVLKSWQHEYKIELASNRQYFEGEPRLKHIKMFMVPEQSTAFALYENNELDYIDNRSFSSPDIGRFRNSPEYHNFALLRCVYLGFNTTKKPFDDARVRRAFSMAINRSVLVQVARRGQHPTFTWIPPGLLGYDAADGIKEDANEARRLLAEAGFPDGKNFPPLDLLCPNREDVKLVVEEMQDQWKRNLHVPINLRTMEWKMFLETLHRDPPAIFRSSWGADYPDPETFANLFITGGGNNDVRYSNPNYDRLIAQAEGEQDQHKRGELYSRADRLLCAEDAAIGPCYLDAQNLMVKPWVHGIAQNPMDLQFFKDVYIQ
jgi:oligopeptide transport system substrate-binding protein